MLNKYSSDKAWFKQIREILKDWYLDLIECTWIRNRLDTHYKHCTSEPPSNNDALAYLYVWKAIDTVLVLEESGGIYLMRGTLLNLAFTGKCAKEWMKETEDEGRQPRTVKQTQRNETESEHWNTEGKVNQETRREINESGARKALNHHPTTSKAQKPYPGTPVASRWHF